MRCSACGRETEKSRYCKMHLTAFHNIIEGYEMWRRATKISWKEYLKEILKNSLTGDWSKEVAQHLMRSGEEPIVKKS